MSLPMLILLRDDHVFPDLATAAGAVVYEVDEALTHDGPALVGGVEGDEGTFDDMGVGYVTAGEAAEGFETHGGCRGRGCAGLDVW